MITTIIISTILLVLIVLTLLNTFYSVGQGTVKIVTRFGKLRKISKSGLNIKARLLTRFKV